MGQGRRQNNEDKSLLKRYKTSGLYTKGPFSPYTNGARSPLVSLFFRFWTDVRTDERTDDRAPNWNEKTEIGPP